jgi:hypothetical protein
MNIKDIEKIIEKESFFSRYKIIEIICLLVIFSIAYKLLEPEYKNFKLNIEKVDTDFTIKSIKEKKKLQDEAIQYFNDKNYSESLKLFTKLSTINNMTISTYYLGLMYEKGYGVNVDINRAVILYKKSTLEGFYSPLIRLRNLILKDDNILNDGIPLSKALKNVALEPNEKNIKELLKFYDSKNIPTISNDFYYEFGRVCFNSLINNPAIFDKVIKEVANFDNSH